MISVLMTNFLQGGPYEFADAVQKAFGTGSKNMFVLLRASLATSQAKNKDIQFYALLLILSF